MMRFLRVMVMTSIIERTSAPVRVPAHEPLWLSTYFIEPPMNPRYTLRSRLALTFFREQNKY